MLCSHWSFSFGRENLPSLYKCVQKCFSLFEAANYWYHNLQWPNKIFAHAYYAPRLSTSHLCTTGPFWSDSLGPPTLNSVFDSLLHPAGWETRLGDHAFKGPMGTSIHLCHYGRDLARSPSGHFNNVITGMGIWPVLFPPLPASYGPFLPSQRSKIVCHKGAS